MKNATDSPRSDDLLLPLHAARGGEALWQACDQLLSAEFPSKFNVGVFQFLHDLPLVVLRSPQAPERDADWWKSNLASHPLMDHIRDSAGLRVQRLTDVLSVEQIKATDYYREFIEPEGWLYSVAMFFHLDGRMLALVGINRAEADGDFTNDEIARLEEIYSHLEIAIARVSALEAERASSEGLTQFVSNAPLPTVLLSWEVRPLFLNRRARELFTRWNTATPQGTLPQLDPAPPIPREIREACEEIRKSVAEATPANNPAWMPEQVTVRHPRFARFKATIRTSPLTAEPMRNPIFAVRIEWTDEPGGPSREEVLARLSPVERELAVKVGRGWTNKDIAANLNKSPATVKTQLESIYRKLEISGRVELAGLVVSE